MWIQMNFTVNQIDSLFACANLNKKVSIRWQDSTSRISGGTKGRRRTLIDGYLESPFSTACLL